MEIFKLFNIYGDSILERKYEYMSLNTHQFNSIKRKCDEQLNPKSVSQQLHLLEREYEKQSGEDVENLETDGNTSEVGNNTDIEINSKDDDSSVTSEDQKSESDYEDKNPIVQKIKKK